ncbi:hypothetical protein [Corynebacterium camporealensis]
MSLNLSLELNTASIADLEALLAAARAAGVPETAALRLEGEVLHVDIDSPRRTQNDQPAPRSPKGLDNTASSVLDAIGKYLENSRNNNDGRGDNFGHFG